MEDAVYDLSIRGMMPRGGVVRHEDHGGGVGERWNGLDDRFLEQYVAMRRGGGSGTPTGGGLQVEGGARRGALQTPARRGRRVPRVLKR